MIKNSKNFFLGCFIFIIPFLGFSLSVKFFLVSLCGFVLVFTSTELDIKNRWKRLDIGNNKKDPDENVSEFVPNESEKMDLNTITPRVEDDVVTTVLKGKVRKPRKKKEVISQTDEVVGDLHSNVVADEEKSADEISNIDRENI